MLFLRQIFNAQNMKKFNLLLITILITASFLSFKNTIILNQMVKVEGGTFKMGSKFNEVADNDEQKEHDVTLKSFEISKFEVTVWEWKQYTKANKLKMPVKPNGVGKIIIQ